MVGVSAFGVDQMQLYIHTYGRVNNQQTLKTFSPALLERTFIVVQAREADAWKLRGVPEGARLLVLPPDIQTLSPTRQWILEHGAAQGYPYICMMDDDLRFSHRLKETGTKLHASEKNDVERMFLQVHDLLEQNFLHVGISAREGNNHVSDSAVEVTRMMRVLAYQPKKVLNLGCRFDRLRTKQDFDLTLQVLRLGFPNIVTYNFAQDQGGSQAAGGCATYRTPQMMAEDAENLRALHPEFVKVVTKATKGAWGGGDRVDVTIAWKKAYRSATDLQILDGNFMRDDIGIS